MSKYLVHRSKRLGFMKSTISKCKSQLRLLEGNRVQPDKGQCTTENEEEHGSHEKEGQDLQDISTFLTEQRILYRPKSGVGNTKDENRKDENEEMVEKEFENIFYDCKEEIIDDQIDSELSNHFEDCVSEDLNEGNNKDMCSIDKGEEDYNICEIEVVDEVKEKGGKCRVKIVIFWLLFMAIGSCIVQIPNTGDEGEW